MNNRRGQQNLPFGPQLPQNLFQQQQQQQQPQSIFQQECLNLILDFGVQVQELQYQDVGYIPQTRSFEFTFPGNFVTNNPGQYLRELLRQYVLVNEGRLTIRMSYMQGVNQLNVNTRNLRNNQGTHRRNLFWAAHFDSDTTELILENMVESFMNSNNDFQWQYLVITLINGRAYLPGGGGDEETVDMVLTRINGLVGIPRNAMNLCGFIGILVHFRLHASKLTEYTQMRELVCKVSKHAQVNRWLTQSKKNSKLMDIARELQTQLTSSTEDLASGTMFDLYTHGDMFVDKYPKFRIVVVDKSCNLIGDMCGQEFMQTYTATETKMEEYCIALMYDNNHFDYLENLSLYYRNFYNRHHKWFMCNVCLKPYTTDKKTKCHECVLVRCLKCKKPFPNEETLNQHLNETVELIECSACTQQFTEGECFEYHARRCGNRDARGRKRCDDCYRWFMALENHKCLGSKKKCLFCGLKMDEYGPHECRAYIEKMGHPKEPLTLEDIYAFDIECMTTPKNGKDVHIPNLIMARRLADKDTQVLKFDTVEQFMTFLTTLEKGCVFFAHNFGGYDGRVLFKYFIEHPQLRLVNAIPNGSKFMAYSIANGKEYLNARGDPQRVIIKFRDSFRHMSQSLRSLPKTYGLDTSKFAKGFYPHTFNRPENRFYKGLMPAIEHFHADGMRSDEKHEFEKWYAQQLLDQQAYIVLTGRHDYYDHYKEFVTYCESDVNVLAEALKVYMAEYMKQCNGLNPLDKVTIASHCMTHYLTNHLQEKTIPQLKPNEFKFAKEAFFGGRTHPCSLLVENSKIGYVDVNSLYPAVMTKCPLPTGHLNFFTVGRAMSNEELLEIHGILEVDIRPTKYLHHAIFPKKDPETFTNSYPLEEMKQVKLTSIEIHTAIKHGYVVDFVYRILQTEVSYELFKTYIYEAQTAKLLASGEPPEFSDPVAKQTFIDEYKQEMNVDLTGMKFEKNAGKRATAKLTNNSLWGKFGENTTRVVMGTYELMKDGLQNNEDTERYTMLMNDIFNGNRLFCHNYTYTNDTTQIAYMFTKEINDGYNEDLKGYTNIMLCAFVTANARMVLWEALNKLGDRVLYCDTDSVIYLLSDDPDENIKSSSKLGEWKDECEGDIITDFVSIAPKSYAYKQANGDVVVKCKGVTLNHENGKLVTFESMKHLVTGEVQKLTTNHLVFDCSKSQKFEVNTLYRSKITKLNKNMIQGELMMKSNQWNLQLPRDYMIFPLGFEKFIQNVQSIYSKRRMK